MSGLAALAAVSVLLAARPFETVAQNGDGVSRDSVGVPGSEGPGTVPFWTGEELRYKVKYGVFGIGEARMRVPGIDTIHDRATYAAEFHLKGGVPGYSLDQKFYTWIDIEGLFSRRFVKDEPDRPREYDFFAEEHRVHQIQDRDTSWTISTSEPLDDVSFVYFARTLPLEVGQTYEFNRYFKEERNPIVLNVLRKDKREVGAGVFNTIVVQPVIPRSSLFSRGGNAEIHFTDDARRLIVYMKVDGPVLPVDITMHLEEFREGAPLEDGGDAGKPEDGNDDSGSSPVSGPPHVNRPAPLN